MAGVILFQKVIHLCCPGAQGTGPSHVKKQHGDIWEQFYSKMSFEHALLQD